MGIGFVSKIIGVYGFEGEPYKLPKFTTRRLFALEFLRQRLIVENDNFLKYKKASSMKFNFTLETFVIRSVYVITLCRSYFEKHELGNC